MDAVNLHQLVLRTSESLTKALKFNRDVLDALQTATARQDCPEQQLQHPTTARSPEALGQDTEPQRQLQSDFASLSSSAPTQNFPTRRPKPPLQSDRDWLHVRPSDSPANSSTTQWKQQQQQQQQQARLQKPPATEALARSGKFERQCHSLESADNTPDTRRTTLNTDLHVNAQSSWENAQNRFLGSIVCDGDSGKNGARRKLGRSLSGSAGDSRLRQKPQQQQQKKPVPPAKKGKTPRSGITKSLTTSADACTASLTASLATSLSLKPPRRPARPRSKVAQTAAELGGPVGHATGAAADVRQREAACLQAVDCLLQVSRQAIGHPALTSAFADTIGRLARDLRRRLEPYRLEADRPFPLRDRQLQQTAEAVRAADESKITGLTQQQLVSLVESLSCLQTQLQFYLRPEAILPAMEPTQRLKYFAEYCCLLLEDCDRVQQQAAGAAANHTVILLTVMRYFVGNQHLLCISGLSGLLMKCYERLERLHGGTGDTSFETRLRQQSKELRSELGDLCELLIKETEQQTAKDQQQQLHRDSVSQGSCEARSKSSTQQQSLSAEQQPALIGVCASADRIIRHLKRLVEAPIVADAADVGVQGARLGRSVGRLILTCERASLRVKEAYLEKLRSLQRKCESREQLRSLPFEFFVSVLTDTLLFRRSLGCRPQADVGVPVGGNDACSGMASTAASVGSRSQDVTSLLGLISSLVCDLYLAIASHCSAGDSVFGGAFQAELHRLICLANRCGLAFLDSAKKRQLHRCLLKLMRNTQAASGGCGGGTGGGRMQQKYINTLIRLLLEIRLHLDRQNLTSSAQLWLVEKTVPFATLTRYLALKGSRVVEFTAWSQDAPQLRELLSPLGKDPAVLRVERQCRCQVTLLLHPDDATPRRCRLKSLLLTVNLRAWHGSHTACIRLLKEVLRAKRFTLEPCEATVQVPVVLQ